MFHRQFPLALTFASSRRPICCLPTPWSWTGKLSLCFKVFYSITRENLHRPLNYEIFPPGKSLELNELPSPTTESECKHCERWSRHPWAKGISWDGPTFSVSKKGMKKWNELQAEKIISDECSRGFEAPSSAPNGLSPKNSIFCLLEKVFASCRVVLFFICEAKIFPLRFVKLLSSREKMLSLRLGP